MEEMEVLDGIEGAWREVVGENGMERGEMETNGVRMECRLLG